MEAHNKHLISIIPTGSQYKTHIARYYCHICQKHINWASNDKYTYWKQRGYIQMLYADFIDDFNRNGIKTPKPHYIYIPSGEKLIWLDVTYQEKDIAKSHGALWHPEEKLWYTHTGNPKLEKLHKYINKDDYEIIYDWLSTRGNRQAYTEITND